VLGVHSIRELNFEMNDQVTMLVTSLMEGHTLILNSLDIVRFDNVAWSVLYSDFSSIKVSNYKF